MTLVTAATSDKGTPVIRFEARHTIALVIAWSQILASSSTVDGSEIAVPDDEPTIGAALAAARTGDVVTVAPGEYIVTAPLSFEGKSIILRSAEGPEATIIRFGDEPDDPAHASVFEFVNDERETAAVDGFTITNGRGSILHGTLPVLNVSIGGGGFLFSGSAAPTIRRCHIVENHSVGIGGGALFQGAASPSFLDCIFTNNSANYRGAAIEGIPELAGGDGGTVSLRDCEIRENHTGLALGPGMRAQLERCEIERNESSGVRAEASADMTLLDCVITENGTFGVNFSAGELLIDRCTIAHNQGVGLARVPDFAIISNSIIWGNHHVQIESVPDSADIHHSCLEWNAERGEGNLFEDPRFCGLEGAQEVFVDGQAAPGGDGTAAAPFRELSDALRLSRSLSKDSPCLGAAEDGGNLGANRGTCERENHAKRVVRIAPGVYGIRSRTLIGEVDLIGAGRDRSILRGGLQAIGAKAELRDLTIESSLTSGLQTSGESSLKVLRCRVRGHARSGIEASGASLDCIDSDFSANGWAGISIGKGSSALIERSTIGRNGSTGIDCSQSDVDIRACRIERNVGNDGAGICLTNATRASVSDTTIEFNQSRRSGGGVACVNSPDVTLQACRICSNHAAIYGGGVYSRSSKPHIDRCEILANEADIGGAIAWPRSEPLIERSTILGNSADEGAAFAAWISDGDQRQGTIVDSIVRDHHGDAFKFFISRDGNARPLVEHSCFDTLEDWFGRGNIAADPLFCGWGELERAHVEASAEPHGDGSPERPFALVADATRFSFGLSEESPCRGSASDGGDMGAPNPGCDAPGAATRTVLLAAGAHRAEQLVAWPGLVIRGESRPPPTLFVNLTAPSGSEIRFEGIALDGETDAPLVNLSRGVRASFRRCRFEGSRTDRHSSIVVRADSFCALEDCDFASNRLELGALIYGLVASTIEITDSRFVSNTARDTSLIWIVGGVVTISDCDFIANGPSPRSLIYASGGPHTIRSCRFIENLSDPFVLGAGPAFLVDSCEFVGNHGRLIFSGGSTGLVVNSLVAGNVAGAAILIKVSGGEIVRIVNCTIAENRVSSDDDFFPELIRNIVLINSIIWGNSEPITDRRTKATYSLVQGDVEFPGERNIVGPPRFVANGQRDTRGTPADPFDDIWTPGDYRLRIDSPAIDAGTAVATIDFDLRGERRSCFGTVDLGAYETCELAVPFRRGDSNADGESNLSDAISTLSFLFGGEPELDCEKAADTDDDGRVLLTDAIYLLGFLFQGGREPPAPFRDCGLDETSDQLTCSDHAACDEP